MPTADQRAEVEFQGLQEFAAQLAETWINGNKTEVLETLLDGSRFDNVELALLVAETLRIRGCRANERLARALHGRRT